MDIKAVAADVTAMLKNGHFEEAGEKYYDPQIASIEAMPDTPPCLGLDAVKAKSDWWYANHEVHSAKVEGPYINGDAFIVRFTIDVTPKATGKRITMDEMGVYKVKNGKIVEERFFYGG